MRTNGQRDTVPSAHQKLYIDKAYFKSYLVDGFDVVKFPVRWTTGQWVGATIMAGTTVFLFSVDGHIQGWAQSNRTPALDQLSKYLFEPIGSGLYSLSAMGILYGCGLISKDDRAKITALKGVEAFILSGITSQIIKQLTHRHRPYQDDPPDPFMWDGPFHGFTNTSFPSGHSATAFAIAAVVATSYQETIWVPILCYTLATGTALSRIYDNDHWASDVLAGSVIGFGIGQLVVHNESRLKVIPVSPTGAGISLVYQF
ncbi:MAG: phosphatase PAP2 family protein [bacterium]